MNQQYNTLAKILHWSIALLILANIAIALYMDDLPRDEKLPVIHLHISLGILILELAIIRIFWIFYKPAPALPESVSARDIKLAKIAQHSLYLLMLLVPVAGYLMVDSKGVDVSFFNFYSLPSVLDKNHEVHEFFEDTHVILAWTMAAIAGLHIAGGIRHLILKNGVFERMWPKF